MTKHFAVAVLVSAAAVAADDPLKDKKRPVAVSEALRPEQAAKQFVLPTGFRCEVIAGEPDIVQPVAFTFDDRGRIWVVENCNYPNSPGEPKDKVLVLEDADGDGTFEKTTVFLTNVTFTTGIAVGFGGVWLGSPPNLNFVPDANGDAIPDGPAEVLLDGWGAEDTHETLNGFTWGPDGWLYGTQGVFTHSKVGKPGTPDKDRVVVNAAVWRFHPTKKIFERWCEGASNQWGIDWNDRGEAFFEACVIPHMWHAIQGARYQRQGGTHVNPHTYDDIKTIAWGRYEKAAYCGAMFYLGGAFPAEWRDKFFFFDIHMNKLRCEEMVRDGSGYKSKKVCDFLYSPDAWFRGLSPQVGPDGAIYFNDWYDKVPCHQQRNFTDRGNGRLYKLVTDAVKPVKVDLTKLGNDELVKLLLSENEWYVRHAKRLLQERGPTPETTKALEEILTKNPDETRQLRALWTLHSMGALTELTALTLLDAKSVSVRGWSVTCLTEAGTPSKAVLEKLAQLAQQDDSPVVRLRLASAAQRIEVTSRWPILEALAAHGEDANDHNLPLMVWYATEPAVAADSVRGAKLLAGVKIPKVSEFIARRLLNLAIEKAAGAQESLGILATELSRGNSAQRASLLRGAMAACEGRKVDLPEPEGWAAAYEKLRADEDAGVRRQARTLSVIFSNAAALEELRGILADEKAELAERRAALATLSARRDAAALDPLLKLAARENRLRREAIRALAGFDDARIVPALLGSFATMIVPEQTDALAALAMRPVSAKAMLAAIDAGKIPKASLSAPVAQNLRGLRDAEVSAWLVKNYGTMNPTSEQTQKEIERYKKFLGTDAILAASVTNGRAIHQRTCFPCHTLFGQGGKIGPELPGNFADVDYLLQNILDPNAVIGRDFQQTFIKTTAGVLIAGVIAAEDAKAVTIKTIAGNEVVPRSEIVSREVSPASMMPPGLLSALQEQEVRDLFLYLRQGKEP